MLDRRRFLTALAAPFAAQAQRRKPNIVILFADDLGFGECGFQGNREIPTPNIDSIASGGVRFTNGYVTAPVCCPSRAGMMTGRYQTRFGHELNLIGRANLEPNAGLPLTERTMAERYKAAGYATGLVGKWHLGASAPYHPLRRGFDEFYGFLHEGHFYNPPPYRGALTRLRTNEPPYDDANPVMRGTDPIVEPEYLTDALAREAVGFIDRHREHPFFLYLAFNAVHSPMQAPVPLVREFQHIQDEQRRLFAAMLSSMDSAAGRVLSTLRERNLDNDTLVFFLSDNGGPTAELTSTNEPLRGGKGQLWEGGIRVPFAVQWKGRIPGGVTYQEPVTSLDILPTGLAAAGAVGVQGLDGVNLLPYLTGEAKGAPHESLFWRYGRSIALRRGNWKIVRQSQTRNEDAPYRLYDLDRDVGETRDAASVNATELSRLREEVEALNREMVAPLWGRA
ncbi:MAG: sulfatase-like hydrolase/transferase [Bryobacteraceae bacterium]